jgi:hypothetical protein
LLLKNVEAPELSKGHFVQHMPRCGNLEPVSIMLLHEEEALHHPHSGLLGYSLEGINNHE